MGGSYASRRAYKSAGAGKASSSQSSVSKSNDDKTRTTKAPAKGSDISKYTQSEESDKIKSAAKRASVINAPGVKYTSVVPGPVYKRAKDDKDLEGYRKAFRDNYNKNTSSSAPAKTEKKKTGGGGGGERRRAASSVSKTNTPSVAAPKKQQNIAQKKGPSPVGLGIPERKKPTVARQYSSTERKINEQIEKVKKGEGVEAAQMKIKSLKEKEKMANMKAERQKNRSNNKALRKSVRAGKFNARQVKKSAK